MQPGPGADAERSIVFEYTIRSANGHFASYGTAYVYAGPHATDAVIAAMARAWAARNIGIAARRITLTLAPGASWQGGGKLTGEYA